MKAYGYSGVFLLRTSLQIQIRVISALILREIITRYGRSNIGFLWLFLEPILFTLGIIIFKVIILNRFDRPQLTFPIIGFVLTGYVSYMSFRNITSRLSKGASANLALLYHQNVTIFDLVVARFLLEFLGMSGAFISLLLGFIYLGEISPPDNVVQSILAWCFLAWFGLGCGLIVSFLSEASLVFQRVWPMILIASLPFSGVLFMVSWMPLSMQPVFLWFPVVNAIEMLREGFFGKNIHALYSIEYLLKSSLITLIIGLILLKKLPSYLEFK